MNLITIKTKAPIYISGLFVSEKSDILLLKKNIVGKEKYMYLTIEDPMAAACYFVLLNLIFIFVAYMIPEFIREKIRKYQILKVNPGDYVLTRSGLYGIAREIMGDAVIVEFGKDEHCRIPIAKSEIQRIIPHVKTVDIEKTKEMDNDHNPS